MACKATSLLIVDPQEVLWLGMKTLLSCHPWQIIAEADDGREALGLVKIHRPNVVILEHCLNSLNGLDLTNLISQEWPDTRIILFTSKISNYLIYDYLRSGASGIILKTDDFDDLVTAVSHSLLKRRHFSSSISEFIVKKLSVDSDNQTDALTLRERQVAQLIAEGNMNKKVAYTLGVSSKTIETHRASIMNKLNLVSTAQLVRYAVRNNLVAI